jgi:hypothetical protein
MKTLTAFLIVLTSGFYVSAQQSAEISSEKLVPLNEMAVAFDSNGTAALEARLNTTSLNGAPDSPVTHIRLVVKNVSTTAYAFVSGVVTFYDAAGVRCGEGIFKADALAVNESFETDTPGLRIRCAPVSWRVVANTLLPRVVPNPAQTPGVSRLIISVDGEQHPIQLDKPLTVNLGDKQRTIVIREAP